jgi:hypothetical protein
MKETKIQNLNPRFELLSLSVFFRRLARGFIGYHGRATATATRWLDSAGVCGGSGAIVTAGFCFYFVLIFSFVSCVLIASFNCAFDYGLWLMILIE